MDPLSPEDRNYVACRITGALLFSIIGAMIFICFLWFGNLNSTLWCLPLEVACLFILSFSKHYLKGELHHKYSAPYIQGVKKVAVIFSFASVCAFLGYIIVGAMNHEVFDERSHYVAAIVASISGFWNSILFTDTKRYEALLSSKGF